ncbi:MAG: hypothetical protein SFT93_00935 [Rickettsiaceae bacterium]|nr:hypothetical protein [Rickettsiaceae bacterium]
MINSKNKENSKYKDLPYVYEIPITELHDQTEEDQEPHILATDKYGHSFNSLEFFSSPLIIAIKKSLDQGKTLDEMRAEFPKSRFANYAKKIGYNYTENPGQLANPSTLLSYLSYQIHVPESLDSIKESLDASNSFFQSLSASKNQQVFGKDFYDSVDRDLSRNRRAFDLGTEKQGGTGQEADKTNRYGIFTNDPFKLNEAQKDAICIAFWQGMPTNYVPFAVPYAGEGKSIGEVANESKKIRIYKENGRIFATSELNFVVTEIDNTEKLNPPKIKIESTIDITDIKGDKGLVVGMQEKRPQIVQKIYSEVPIDDKVMSKFCTSHTKEALKEALEREQQSQEVNSKPHEQGQAENTSQQKDELKEALEREQQSQEVNSKPHEQGQAENISQQEEHKTIFENISSWLGSSLSSLGSILYRNTIGNFEFLKHLSVFGTKPDESIGSQKQPAQQRQGNIQPRPGSPHEPYPPPSDTPKNASNSLGRNSTKGPNGTGLGA